MLKVAHILQDESHSVNNMGRLAGRPFCFVLLCCTYLIDLIILQLKFMFNVIIPIITIS